MFIKVQLKMPTQYQMGVWGYRSRNNKTSELINKELKNSNLPEKFELVLFKRW